MNRVRTGWASLLLLLGLLACTSGAWAVTAQRWSISTDQGFGLGTLDGTAVDEQGRVVLAPTRRTLWGPDEGIVWDVATSSGGAAFLALSGPGRLARVTEQDGGATWFTAEEEGLVTAVAEDGAGGAFIGLSPEGRVLHVSDAESAVEVVSTEAKFIWSLARSDDGSLWIGTGLPGLLLHRSSDGAVETVFEAGDDPIRCIAVQPDGNVLIGTGGRGRVLRVNQDGRAFVLWDADEPEIVALAAGTEGELYALTALASKQVTSQPQAAAPTAPAGNVVRVVVTPPSENPQEQKQEPPKATAKPKGKPRLKTVSGGALYRIGPDGDARRIWTAANAMPFDLIRTSDGRLLVATGDQGKLFMLDGEGRASKLLRIPSDQASALALGREGRVLIGGTTDARLELLGPERNPGGRYLTPAVDAGRVASWGRLRWEAEVPRGTKLDLEARTGNSAEPDETWSDWVPIEGRPGSEGAESGVPPARWFQARARISSKGEASPSVRRLEVVYLPRNRSPEVHNLTVEASGIVILRGPVQSSTRRGPLIADDPVSRQTAKQLRGNGGKVPIRRAYEGGARSLSWSAVDPDGDRLRYSLEIRREDRSEWLPLAVDLEDAFHSWDARALPDGLYRVRLTANDATDNPWDRRLSHSMISEIFPVDNSRPSVESFEVGPHDEGHHIRFVASDEGGAVAAVEVAVDGGEWTPVEPVDGVADSGRERFELVIEEDSEERVRSLLIRVTDTAGNIGGEMERIPER